MTNWIFASEGDTPMLDGYMKKVKRKQLKRNGRLLAYYSEWDYARQLLDAERKELSLEDQEAIRDLRDRLIDKGCTNHTSDRQFVQLSIIRYAQSICMVKNGLQPNFADY